MLVVSWSLTIVSVPSTKTGVFCSTRMVCTAAYKSFNKIIEAEGTLSIHNHLEILLPYGQVGLTSKQI